MRTDRLIILFSSALVLLAFFTTACIQQPEFPAEPKITFESIAFREMGSNTAADSLILTINFQDGDGNLGLSNDDNSSPYNERFYFVYVSGEQKTYKASIEDILSEISYNLNTNDYNNYLDGIITIEEALQIVLEKLPMLNAKLVTLSDRLTAAFDSIPPYRNPYTCTNYTILKNIDTIYYEHNIYYHNILVDFFVEGAGGTFREFDWVKEFCNISHDGRFPVLLPGQDKERPLEGSIRYSMPSYGFKSLFNLKRLKLRVQIIDRALNKSNEIETPVFTLQEITIK